MRRRVWAAVRLVGAVTVLAVLVWRVGTGPILDGLRTINGSSLVAAAGIGVVTTLCSAWRWSLVARGLGVGVPLRAAVTAYYRSQFLNSALPGGVLGDVHRGVRHGRDVGDVGRGLRAVGWERAAGQAVQAVLSLVVLCLFPSPVRSVVPMLVVALVIGPLAATLLVRARRRRRATRWSRILSTAAHDVRCGLLDAHAGPAIALASVVVVAGHAATFLVAARTAGVTAPLTQLLPLAMLALLAMAVPMNVAGWGPREGVAAWSFGAAGLGAGTGIATATVYGVMVLVASLPGAAAFLAAWRRRGRERVARGKPARWPVPVTAPTGGAVRG
jgi:glycosyltransferase 2 family protein